MKFSMIAMGALLASSSAFAGPGASAARGAREGRTTRTLEQGQRNEGSTKDQKALEDALNLTPGSAAQGQGAQLSATGRNKVAPGQAAAEKCDAPSMAQLQETIIRNSNLGSVQAGQIMNKNGLSQRDVEAAVADFVTHGNVSNGTCQAANNPSPERITQLGEVESLNFAVGLAIAHKNAKLSKMSEQERAAYINSSQAVQGLRQAYQSLGLDPEVVTSLMNSCKFLINIGPRA